MIPSTLRVAWARLWGALWGALRPGSSDNDFVDELQCHLDLAVDDLISQGHQPDEARRLARVQLGNLSLLREDRRARLGLPWLGTFWLDIKLGLRMLRKTWGLSLVGGLAMALTITIALVVFWGLETVLSPTMPLDEGDRIVALQTWDERTGRRAATERADFDRWRDHLASVEQVSAFRGLNDAIDAGTPSAVPVRAAKITADGLRLTRIDPVLGRLLQQADEAPSAEPVVVISHDLWQQQWRGRHSVLGDTVKLVDGVHTIVGVLPQGFSFPVNHELWLPLRTNDDTDLPTVGPEGAVFGRRVRGVALDQVQAEISSLGVLDLDSESATDSPRGQRVARAAPFALAMTGDFEPGQTAWAIRLALLAMTLLLVPPCANIAILVYARIVSRQQEFASRLALGAGRARIVSQVFLEVLVLSSASALLATAATALGLRAVGRGLIVQQGDQLPFWIDFSLSPRTVTLAACLAVVAAAIAGVLPALKATSGRASQGMTSLGQRTALKLGPTWTVLVIGQVALTLAALPAALEMAWGTVRDGLLGPGFPAHEFVMTEMRLEPLRVESPESSDLPPAEYLEQRYGQLEHELRERLAAEPGVTAVASAAAAPGDEPWAWFTSADDSAHPPREESEDSEPASDRGPTEELLHQARYNAVDSDWFAMLDQTLLTGRSFEAQDFASDARPVIVSQTFAEQMFGARSPLGRQLRRRVAADEVDSDPRSQPTFEVIGVVEDRPSDARYGTLYHPLSPGDSTSSLLTFRVGAGAADAAARVRELATGLHAGLEVERSMTLADLYRDQERGNNLGAAALLIVTLSVLSLSAAGIYAMTSFTIRQRRREIGIRAALGAQPARLLSGIFRRVLMQIGAGAALGSGTAMALGFYLPIERLGGAEIPAAVPLAVVLMVAVALLAAAGPSRRGLKLDVVEELRDG